MLEGEVARIKGNQIIVSLGKNDRIKQRMHLILFQEGEPVILNGKTIGSDTEEFGTGRIIKLEDEMSYAELFKKETLSKLKVGTRFITK
jgi:hypothetical protein